MIDYTKEGEVGCSNARLDALLVGRSDSLGDDSGGSSLVLTVTEVCAKLVFVFPHLKYA